MKKEITVTVNDLGGDAVVTVPLTLQIQIKSNGGQTKTGGGDVRIPRKAVPTTSTTQAVTAEKKPRTTQARTGTKKTPKGNANGRSTVTNRQIRSWAQEQGIRVAPKGRIAMQVRRAYRQAQRAH